MNAIEQTAERVRADLARGAWKESGRLPPLSALALQYGVSGTTIWKAVALLKKESLLFARRGGAITRCPPLQADASTASSGFAWERLKVRIGRDIHQGAFGDGALPPLCKLARQFGCGIGSVRHALDELCGENLLVRVGRSYRQVRTAARGGRQTMVLIEDGKRDGGMYLYDMRLNQVLEYFERECIRLGYAPACEYLDDTNPASLLALFTEIRSRQNVAGFIVPMWQPQNEAFRKRWIDLLTFLLGRRVPVIVIDQSGTLDLPDALTQSPLFRMLRIAGRRAGEQLAETLMRLGHKDVAYLSAYFKTDWGRDRFEGLQRYYKQYGNSRHTVTKFVRDEVTYQNDLILPFLSLNAKNLGVIFQGRATEEQIHEMASRLRSIKKHPWANQVGNNAVAETIRPMADLLAKLSDRQHDPAALEGMRTFVLHLADSGAQEEYLQAIYQEALASSRATVWVCSEDKTAMDAITFLKRNGKRVPQDIAVVCFENYRGAIKNRITAFDFNMNGMVQEALLLIVDRKARRTRPPTSVVDGYVVERRTTRR